MARVTNLVAGEVKGLDGVASVGTNVGRALTSDRLVDVNSAELWVSLAATTDAARATQTVRDVVAGYPGVASDVRDYGADRLDAAAPAAKGDLVVRVYGTDYATLSRTAGEVAEVLSSVRGVVSPQAEVLATQPTVRIEVDLARAKTVGLKPGDVRREAATLISGLLVGNLYEQQKVFDVVVWGGPALRYSPSSLGSLLIDTPSGKQVRLGDVATVSVAPEPVVVAHDAVNRYLDVVASVPGGNWDAVAAEVSTRLRAMAMPQEYRAEVVGTASPGEVGGQTWWYVLAALIAALLVVQAAVRSWRAALLVMLTLPLAVAGALLVAPLVGGIRTAGALAGMTGILVLAARHVLVIVHGISERVRSGDESPAEAVISVTRRQAYPVVVSALAIAAAFLPAAVMAGEGLEILHPAAVVVLAGLVTSVLVTLVVLPGLYLAFTSAGPRRSPPLTTTPIAVDGADRHLTPASTSSEGN
jgi:Cu/Ag efflux pump CusA